MFVAVTITLVGIVQLGALGWEPPHQPNQAPPHPPNDATFHYNVDQNNPVNLFDTYMPIVDQQLKPEMPTDSRRPWIHRSMMIGQDRPVENLLVDPMEADYRPIRGVKGELNIKWSVMPIMSRPKRRSRRWLDGNQRSPSGHFHLRPAGWKRRPRRDTMDQLVPTIRQFMSNVTNSLKDGDFRERVTNQWRSSVNNAGKMLSNVMQTMQNQFRKLNLGSGQQSNQDTSQLLNWIRNSRMT